MNVLVINAGSSSIKYQLIDMDTENVMAKGLLERIGIGGTRLKHRAAGKDEAEINKDCKDHIEGMKLVLDTIVDKDLGVISSMDEIHAVGHRVAHGGEYFSGSAMLDEAAMDAIKANIDLAPLHNPANIMGIEACRSVMPNTPMTGTFDTAFHQSIPGKAYMYAIDYTYYEKYRVRRYGFHGTSHMYVSKKAAEFVGKPLEDLKIITCHLGNGSSIAAVDGGKSVDTSMGFTPLEGVVMGTRSGDIDPAIIEFLMAKENMTVAQVMNMLNKNSGLLGVSGISSDMRDIEAGIAAGNERAELAQSVFCYRVKKYIGAYAAAMGGLDVVVMTAGIGENVISIRKRILEGMEFFGIDFDEDLNKGRGDRYISKPGSRTAALVIATDEEMVIARDTVRIVDGK